MARVRPPSSPSEKPLLITLPAGETFYRVHRSRFDARAFNPTPSHRYFDGGRFDATDDDLYGYMYAGQTPEVAIAETLLRDCPISSTGAITISRAQIAGRRLSQVTLRSDVEVVDLCGLQALRRASQDTWLTVCDPCDYAQTRHWGHWIRAQAPEAAGFVWHSKRDTGSRSFVFFEDRGAAFSVDAGWRYRGVDLVFDRRPGLDELRWVLAQYNADVESGR